MKKSLYQLFVYLTLAITLISTVFFIYEMSVATFNSWSILCLVLMLVGLILFVVNQIIYRQFKKRDESRYIQIECPHCHHMNAKNEEFCKKCGKPLH